VILLRVSGSGGDIGRGCSSLHVHVVLSLISKRLFLRAPRGRVSLVVLSVCAEGLLVGSSYSRRERVAFPRMPAPRPRPKP
jgi:hypothetical protein